MSNINTKIRRKNIRMSKNIKTKKKGVSGLDFEFFGGSELGEKAYKSKKKISKQAQQKTLAWSKRKLGKVALMAFGKV